MRTDYTPSGNKILLLQCVSNCCTHFTLYTPGAIVSVGPVGAPDPGPRVARLFDKFFGQ